MGCVGQQSACTSTHTVTHILAVPTHTHIQSFPLKTLQRAKFTADSASTVRYRPCVCSVQDLSHWQSSKTGRGPLEEGWKDDHKPIMCSYKRVQCSFEVYGFQTRTEEFIHRVRQLDFPSCLFAFADLKESLIKMWSAVNVASNYRWNTRWEKYKYIANWI